MLMSATLFLKGSKVKGMRQPKVSFLILADVNRTDQLDMKMLPFG